MNTHMRNSPFLCATSCFRQPFRNDCLISPFIHVCTFPPLDSKRYHRCGAENTLFLQLSVSSRLSEDRAKRKEEEEIASFFQHVYEVERRREEVSEIRKNRSGDSTYEGGGRICVDKEEWEDKLRFL